MVQEMATHLLDNKSKDSDRSHTHIYIKTDIITAYYVNTVLGTSQLMHYYADVNDYQL